jgi:proline dehydrogenase
MLLGVREDRRDSLIKSGHRVRIYVPFGDDWYGYSTRRLKENPQVAGYVAKAVLTGK